MDILATDAVSPTKVNALFDYWKTTVDAKETVVNTYLARYAAILADRTALAARKATLEALYDSIVSASSSSLPSLTAQSTINSTNNTNLTSTEASVTSLTSRIGAIVPGTTHLAYGSQWASSKFASFSPSTGQCVGTNSSGNWISTTAPKSNGYPELATAQTISSTNGGSLTANTWTARAFTTLTKTGFSWVALDSGDISLYPGFYVLRYVGVTNGVDQAQTKIINRTTSALLRKGSSVNGVTGTDDASSFTTTHRLFAIFQFTVPTIIQFQVKASTVNSFNANYTLGRAMTGISNNIYQHLDILRLEGR